MKVVHLNAHACTEKIRIRNLVRQIIGVNKRYSHMASRVLKGYGIQIMLTVLRSVYET